MALDECTPFPAHRGRRCGRAWSCPCAGPRARAPRSRRGPATRSSASCRAACIRSCGRSRRRRCTEIGFEGYAIGGLAVGEGQAAMFAVLEATVPLLPADRPRYLMGVGTPDDLVGAVQRGIDMFDCVMPTRAGRTARAYTSQRRAQPAQRPPLRRSRPLDPACACPACTRHSRAYLHHLFRAERDAGADAADRAQPHLLPGPDARPARRHIPRRPRGARRSGCAPPGPPETSNDPT